MTPLRGAAALAAMANALRLSPRQHARLERLGERGVLTPEQVAVVRDELDPARATSAPAGTGIWEVLGYIGGALVLGGASLLVGTSWEDLTRTARVVLLAVATLVLAGSGTSIGGGPREVRALADREPSPRGRLVTVLFALASGTAALAVGTGVRVADSILATAAGLLVALLGYAAVRGLPVLVAAGGFSVAAVVSTVDEWFDATTLPATVGLIALGALWAGLAAAGVLRHRQPVLGGGALIALVGAQQPIGTEQPWWAYGLTLLLALLCFAAYLVERTAVLLALGVVGVTVAVPEAVWDWTGGALSGPVTVLLVGAVFLAAGGTGLRLRRTQPQTQPGGSNRPGPSSREDAN